MGGAVLAEFFRLGDELVGVDDRRLVLFLVVAVEPGKDDADVFLAGGEELLAAPRREVDVLGGGMAAVHESGGEDQAADDAHRLSAPYSSNFRFAALTTSLNFTT